jgi:hypothetical protein
VSVVRDEAAITQQKIKNYLEHNESSRELSNSSSTKQTKKETHSIFETRIQYINSVLLGNYATFHNKMSEKYVKMKIYQMWIKRRKRCEFKVIWKEIEKLNLRDFFFSFPFFFLRRQ